MILVCVLLFNSCKEQQKPLEVSESEKVNEFFEAQFDLAVSRSPMLQTRLGIKTDYDKWDDISPESEAQEIESAKTALDWLSNVDTLALDESTFLSYKLYKQRLIHTIEDNKWRLYSYPLNQMHGLQAEIPAFLINMHKIKDSSDAKAYISRLYGIKPMFEQLEKNLAERESAGIMVPKFVFNHVINDSKNLIKGYPFNEGASSTLYNDFIKKIEALDISKSEKKDFINSGEIALLESVKPAYENLITFLKSQYNRATTDDGIWKWPNGEAFYKNALLRTTTTTMTANEIHELGLSEVNRIHKAMNKIKSKVGFDGDLQSFFKFMKEDDQFYYPDTDNGKQSYIKDAKQLIDNLKGELDKMFITKPKADMVVKAVEPFREKSAGKAFYQSPAIDGSRPGTYYANTYRMAMMPKYQMEALAFHEGIPGHHMQIAIAQELEDVPKFRKFGGYTAYIEGWGLYSEFLPKEFGFYSDPYSDFGRLAMELWRACRLVVDTGIHTKKWTREEGIAYYANNTPNDMLDCVKMVERHIVMPSQATAYKIGMNKILELRAYAESQMGEQFDIRKFHELVLKDGAVPLNILEDHVYNYIATSKN
jgi:uncharacterized protein (DUF885 family)